MIASTGRTRAPKPPTSPTYVERRTAEVLSKREIIRCLKRYIAREIWATLPRPETPAQPALAA